MTTHGRWDGDLDRDDLLALTPAEAFAGGLVGERAASAPALLTVCALALAHQASAEGAPTEALGLALAAFGMVADRVGTGALDDGARAGLLDQLAFQAEGYPRTGAWLAALAGAVRGGADLEVAQAFLTRAIDLSRYTAR